MTKEEITKLLNKKGTRFAVTLTHGTILKNMKVEKIGEYFVLFRQEKGTAKIIKYSEIEKVEEE